MKRIVLIFIGALVCSISACTKNDDPGPGNSNIVGKWRWVKSVGGIGGFTLTPKSTGYNFRDEFYADSTFKRIKNDTLLVNGNFRTNKNYKVIPTGTVDLLLLTGPALDSAPVSYLIRHDTLYRNDIFISDGFNSVYVRIK
jgi:hypothetical protein